MAGGLDPAELSVEIPAVSPRVDNAIQVTLDINHSYRSAFSMNSQHILRELQYQCLCKAPFSLLLGSHIRIQYM
jgi:hypothetical protein